MAIATRPCTIRPMSLHDIPEVMDIERRSFPSSWPQTLYQRELKENRLAHYLVIEAVPDEPDHPSMPLWMETLRQRLFRGERPRRVLGLVGIWFMVGEGHIVTFAVEPEVRRQGLGEALLLAAIDLAIANDQDVLSLECRVSNTAAQALYEKYGFLRVGLRRRYYSDNGEDALIMTTEALTSPAYQSRLTTLQRLYEERRGPSA